MSSTACSTRFVGAENTRGSFASSCGWRPIRAIGFTGQSVARCTLMHEDDDDLGLVRSLTWVMPLSLLVWVLVLWGLGACAMGA